nr:hypothetical protein [Bacteroides sp.]
MGHCPQSNHYLSYCPCGSFGFRCL